MIAIFLFTVSGCKSNIAYSYNQKIIRIEKGLDPYIDEAMGKFNIFHENKNYDSVIIISQDMENRIEKGIKEIQEMNMSTVEGGDTFKRAAIKYFSQMKNVFTAYKSFAIQTDEETREVERQRLIEITNEYEIDIETMRTAQRKFAATNNFRIKEK